MTANDQPRPHSGARLGAVADILRHHRWKIILISILGVIGAAAYYFSAPRIYVSQAKLMVRYIVERSAVDQVQFTWSLGQGGDSIMKSEKEILTSWDLAEKVASLPVMCKMESKSKTPVNPQEVAAVISGGLKVASVKGSNVLLVSFKNEDRDLVSKVLDQLLQQYFIKHLEIHRSKEAAKIVADRVERSRTKLRSAGDELTKLKTENGILSLPDTLAAVNAEGARTQSGRNAIELELAGQRARVATLERLMAAGDGAESASAASIRTGPAAKAGVEELSRRLRMELMTGKAQIAALEAQSEQLKETLASTQKNLSALAAIIPRIAEKELARDIEITNYKLMSASLEKTQIDEALDGSRMPNISIVQEATPAGLELNGRNKMALGIACGTPGVAIAGVLLFGLIFNGPPRASSPIQARERSGPDPGNVDSQCAER